MRICYKRTHPQGLHPQVIARLFRVNLRTVFRLFTHGEIKQVGRSLLGDKDQIFQVLTDYHRTYPPIKVRRELQITNGTLFAWRKNGILRTTRVMGNVRYDLASVQSIRRLKEYQPGKKKVLIRRSVDTEIIREKIDKLYNAFTPEIDMFAKEQARMTMGIMVRNFQKDDTAIRLQITLKLKLKKKP